MTVREHIQKAHSVIAESHRALAKCHAEAMGKAIAGGSDFHKAAQAAHENAADAHDQMCQECEKATASELAKMIPTRVSAVTPTAPVTPVLRTGQRTIPIADTVDQSHPMFRKLVTVDEEEEGQR